MTGDDAIMTSRNGEVHRMLFIESFETVMQAGFFQARYASMLCISLIDVSAILNQITSKTRRKQQTVIKMLHCCVLNCTNDYRYMDNYKFTQMIIDIWIITILQIYQTDYGCKPSLACTSKRLGTEILTLFNSCDKAFCENDDITKTQI